MSIYSHIIATTLSVDEFAEIIESGETDLTHIDDEHDADAYEIASFKNHIDLHDWICERYTYDDDAVKRKYDDEFIGMRYYLDEDGVEELNDFVKNHKQYVHEEDNGFSEGSDPEDWEDSIDMMDDIYTALDEGYNICYYSYE